MSDFLNWELTNRMHDLGYDGKTLMYINDEEDIINDDSAELIGAKPAILTSAAFRWFREKYGLYSWVKLHNGYINDSFYKKLPITWTIMESESGKQYYERDIDHNYLYHTHEEAELACLDKLLEIVESKSE